MFQKKYWHNGYAIESAKACKEYAFNELKSFEVCPIIRTSNYNSIKVAMRNGMKKDDSWVKKYRGIDMLHDRYIVRK